MEKKQTTQGTIISEARKTEGKWWQQLGENLKKMLKGRVGK